MTNSHHRRSLTTLRFFAYVLALGCFASGFSTSRAATPLGRPVQKVIPLSKSSTADKLKHSPNHQNHNKYAEHHTTIFVSSEDTIEQEQSVEEPSNKKSQSTDLQPTSNNARRNRRIQIAIGLVSSIALLAGAAKTGLLLGPLEAGGGYGPYTDEMILRDSCVTGLTAVLAVVLVKFITFGYEKGWYDSTVGRKLNHILAAPLFILFFPAFSPAEGARFFAGLVTLSNILRLYLAGTGKGDSSLAQTISRSGDKKEVLAGPFIYVCIFQILIWLFWRSSFVGVTSMLVMSSGDGMADLVGRKWGADNRWSFSDGSKSKAGTLAFVLSAFVTSFGLVNWLIVTGCLQSTLGTTDLAVRLLLISFVTAFVELLPFGDDNYTVPGTAAVLAGFLLH